MANITDPWAVKFSNTRARVAGDQLAQAYYACKALSQQWNSLGGGATALSLLLPQFRAAADRLVTLYEFCARTEKVWFLGVNALFPNDASLVFDNTNQTAQDPARPPLTGANVNALVNRVVELQNWLFSATESFTDSARNNAAAYNTVLQVSGDGVTNPALSDAGNFINRCNELTTNYEANTNANLGTVLKVAVNPGG